MGYFAQKYGNQSMAPNQSIAPIQSMLPKKPPIAVPKKPSILQSILNAIKNAPKKNIQQAGKAVMGVSKVGEGILKFGKETLIEAPARAAGAIALDLTKQKTLQPKSPLEQLFFGKEQVESISKQIKESPARAEKTFGIPKKYGKIIGPSAVIGLTALDLTPMGKITKPAKVVKPSIVKSIIEQGAKQTERIAPQAAKAMRSIDISKQTFSSLDDVVKTIKTAIGKQGDDVIGAATRYADNYAQMLKDPALAKKASEQLFDIGGGIKPPSVPPKAPPIEEITDPIVKITQAIKGAKSLQGKQAALYSAERAKRFARFEGVGQKISGEQGAFAQLGQLKGGLPKVEFETLRNTIKQGDIDTIFSKVQQAPHLLIGEKATGYNGLIKLFGKEGGALPNKSELKILSEVFPKEFIDAVLEKRPLMSKLFEGTLNALNLPRAMMATADLSAPLRQGVFLIGKPKQWLPAFRDMFKYAFSEKAYQGLLDDIQLRPTYMKMKEGGLALTDMGKFVSNREEAFASNIAENIPIFGRIAKGSNRAYSGFLNKLRADVFDDLFSKAKDLGIEPPVENLARFINAATGRGNLPKVLSGAAPVLNATFFSPRLMASRLNLLNPVFYAKLDPFTRKEALKSLLTFGAVAGTTLGLAKLGGAEVETNPSNANFGKIKIGNTRYDVLGGFQQYIRLSSQLISGKIISSTSGREITLGEGYKPLTRKDITLRFFESKENPFISFATALFTGQNQLGQDVNVPTEITNRMIPLVIQDLYDLYKEGGLQKTLMWLPTPFGVGTQTYGKTELVSGENPLGEPTAQIRQIPGLGEKIVESTLGKQPLGSSKSFDVEVYYDQLEKMPKEQAAKIFDDIAKTNPELAKQLSNVAKDRKKGITIHDKDLKAKGVQSGDRAKAIVNDLNKKKTKEEKAQLWDEYVKKGILTKDVSEQVLKLLQKK